MATFETNATNLAWIDNDDLNGECFILGETGEVEEVQNHRKVYFGPNTPAATTPGTPAVFTNVQAGAFIILNAFMSAKAEGPAVTITRKHARIAFLRFLAARAGLISPAFQTAPHHVRYNEAVRLSAEELGRLKAAHADWPTAAAIDATLLPDEDRKFFRINFANLVCCVAYMFRVRGHHYLDDMDARYKVLWQRCMKGNDIPLLEWRVIAHDCLHAIFPIVLDQFWLDMAAGGRIAGALVKRLDSPCAGSAAIRAVYAGGQDLIMAVPGIKKKFEKHFDDLDGIMGNIRANRWAGSINKRFYGAPDVAFDEQKFGAIASVIWHALGAFAANSPLLKSKALERVANNAPITGGIVSRSIATVATDPKIVRELLITE